MPRLLLVEQYFYPDGWGGAEIPRDIAVGLRQAGYAVDVLCSRDQYAPLPPGSESPDPRASGVRILRAPRIFPGPIHRLKLLRILWFCIYALPRLLVHRGVDLYVTQTNPLLIVPTVALAAALRRRPFMIIAQDLYPEALFAAGVASPDSFSAWLLGRLFSWAYRRASAVVALGSFMHRRIAAKGVSSARIHTISNWATGDLHAISTRDNPLRSEWGIGARFVVLYSGNLGVGHEFETLIRGVQQAVDAGADPILVIIGGGVRLPEVRAFCERLGIAGRVIFKGFVPAHMLPWTLGLADLAAVTLREGFEGVVVPSKLFGYMARAVPVLYVGPDSDAAEIVRDSLCGACCRPGDPQAVAAALLAAARDAGRLRQWGENGRSYYLRHLGRERGIVQYVALVRRTLEGG